MSESRFPSRKLSQPDSADPGSGCPPSEKLAAYLDGRLDPASRESLGNHVSRCDECYFVVREIGLYLDESEAVVRLAATADVLSRSRPKVFRSAVLKYLAPLAAVVLVGTSVAIWRHTGPADRYAAQIADLVRATGQRRYIDGRLEGGFQYGPVVDRLRAGTPAVAERPLELRAAAAKVLAGAERSSTRETRRAVAAADLLLGDADRAVAVLEALTREAPADAGAKNDLAAAYLERAQRGNVGDFERALAAATEAVRLDPTLREAWFNQALAARSLGRTAVAEAAQSRLRELEGESPWLRSLASP